MHIPYILEICIVCIFSILFFWILAGFLTALMGLIQLYYRKNKNSIYYSLENQITVHINPKHHTAIIMTICNKDVSLAFAGLRAT